MVLMLPSSNVISILIIFVGQEVWQQGSLLQSTCCQDRRGEEDCSQEGRGGRRDRGEAVEVVSPEELYH